MSGFVERRGVGRWRARYRGPDHRERSKTFERKVDADRWLSAQTSAIDRGTWLDPARSAVSLADWAADWVQTRHDLRETTRARLQTTLSVQVLPVFGSRRLS